MKQGSKCHSMVLSHNQTFQHCFTSELPINLGTLFPQSQNQTTLQQIKETKNITLICHKICF